uniref:Uncharacterized protein n=1 Tax=Cyanothece sp. (strain PCC 7425 / ATCC 29141) TaxID=395961 RepID=B8HPS2_CYAP4
MNVVEAADREDRIKLTTPQIGPAHGFKFQV